MSLVVAARYTGLEVAIIGMAGRFPGARTLEEFWQNLQAGVEAVAPLSNADLQLAGVDPAVFNQPNYVKASVELEEVDQFDAKFFGYSPREAEIMDPQHRLFLECAWQALENAGYSSQSYEKAIGVYASVGTNSYLLNYVYPNPDVIAAVGIEQAITGNEKDYLSTLVSYKLNLAGPSISIQTACSSSLVSVHLACQGLLSGDCEMALAGGVSISLPQKVGYPYQDGSILSPDGHCRAFDAQARGVISGRGLGIVVLKRLEDALKDGDRICAVIKGSAINNDGALKIGYTAPSIEGQAKVIRAAQLSAEVDAETITYVEAHGTGTPLGDPIEIVALTQAFRASTEKTGFCAIGSLKTNIGHLDIAAGIAGLIKTTLTLQHRMLPPSLNFQQPNPKIDFANSPFYVNTRLTEWKSARPRRAGVSSFGIGGTNAHVVLEEAPTINATDAECSCHLLVLSAKTKSALETITVNLAQYLQQHSHLNLADVAHTLQRGRCAFNHRRIVIAQTIESAIHALNALAPNRAWTNDLESTEPSVIFLFPGQGSQYVNMGRNLYQEEPTFRAIVDRCADLLRPQLGLDLRTILYPTPEAEATAAKQLQKTALAQPALFVIEYALAKLWVSWGVKPQAMIGHSIGEYVAACLARVLSLEDALSLVAMRGQLMQAMPHGAMLAVSLPELELRSRLPKNLSIAAINTASACVVSGETASVMELQQQLTQQGINCQLLHTSHAFHSAMMEPMLASFREQVQRVAFKPPQIPYISNVSGTWITAEAATNPTYWATHLRQTVLFAQGIQELRQPSNQVLLEVGPGHTLSTLVKQDSTQSSEPIVLTSLRHPREQDSDLAFLLTTLGRVWLAGVMIDWSEFHRHHHRHRIPLPTYPFEHQRYWIDPPSLGTKALKQPPHSLPAVLNLPENEQPELTNWFYLPSWKRSQLPQPIEFMAQNLESRCWLLFVDSLGIGDHLRQKLELAGQTVICVHIGEPFDGQQQSIHQRDYTIHPSQVNDYATLLAILQAQGRLPQKIVHLWSLTESADQTIEQAQTLGLNSLLFLAQAIGHQTLTQAIELTVVCNHIQTVTGDEVLCPEKSLLLGAVKVIPLEYEHVACRSVDIILPAETCSRMQLVTLLLQDLITPTSDAAISYRGGYRWVQTFEPIRLDETFQGKRRLKPNGVYLITGGLGKVGLTIARYLAETARAKLILVGRSAFPERQAWPQWLLSHGQEDAISQKIQQLQAIEALGSEVWIAHADVAQREPMQAIVMQAELRFGSINGIVHAAGILQDGAIQGKTLAELDQPLQSKVQGTFVLTSLFPQNQLDFLILFSSISAIAPVFGQVAYCAANNFLDTFAQRHAGKQKPFIAAINWDVFGETSSDDAAALPRQNHLRRWGILPHEGSELFSRILGSSLPQVLVSPANRINFAPSSRPISTDSGLEPVPQTHRSLSTHARPQLETEYISPTDETEQALADIWQELFGIEAIGIYDDFFELGGDSLFAIRLLARMRETLAIELPLDSLFETSTIASLAQVIRQTTDGPSAGGSNKTHAYQRENVGPMT